MVGGTLKQPNLMSHNFLKNNSEKTKFQLNEVLIKEDKILIEFGYLLNFKETIF